MQVILKQLTGQKLSSLHKTTGTPLLENPDFGVREIFACEIQNPWNPESKTGRLESSTWNPESTAKNREFKAV